ncbi:MAG: dTDP-4-dehydrorhamnose reductase [Cellulosilyticaceae bacterium]
MKVLVTGYNGQLGYDVVKELERNNIECIGVGRDVFDLQDEEGLKSYVRAYNPDVVVHCAAYTAVDKAEDECEICYDVNVKGSTYLAEVCLEIGAKIMYISTDYVYNGEGNKPFCPNEAGGAKNQYGATKYAGELAIQKIINECFIVRVSWVFGRNGNNFVETMKRLGETRDSLNIINDQIGSPTYTVDLAVLIVQMIQTDKYGIYNASNEGFCSWYDFAKEIFAQLGYETKVNPISTSEYPTRAVRPLNSRMSKTCLDEAGFYRLPTWQDALKRYIRI